MTRLIVSIFLLLLPTAAFADSTSFQFQMPSVKAPKGDDVTGMRIVFLYGENNKVSGFDMGLASFSEAQTRSGLSLNMGAAHVKGASSGCACSLINIHEGEDTGANVGFVNIVKTLKSGANVSFLNLTEGSSAIDIGGLNMSKKSKTQIGFLNVTEEITGFQFGFVNMAENGMFPVFILFNKPK